MSSTVYVLLSTPWRNECITVPLVNSGHTPSPRRLRRNLMKIRRALVATAGLITLLIVARAVPIRAQSNWTVVMSGLNNPRGLTFVLGEDDDDWALYVAESGNGGSGPCAMVRGAQQCAGTTGAVTRYQGGVQQRIVTGLPSVRAGRRCWRHRSARRVVCGRAGIRHRRSWRAAVADRDARSVR